LLQEKYGTLLTNQTYRLACLIVLYSPIDDSPNHPATVA